MNALQNFDYQGNSVRSFSIDGDPWFVAKDVCDILGLGETHVALRRLGDDEKGRYSIPTLGGSQQMLTVNEPGLYALIHSSRKPEAKTFTHWVNHEVLPTIRKRGSYTTPGLETSDEQYLKELERKVDRLTDLVIQQSQALFAVQTHLLTSAGGQSKPRQAAIVREAGMRPVSSFYGSTHKVITAGYADEVAKLYRSGQTQKVIAAYLQSCGVDITDMSVSRFIRRYLK